MHIQYTQIHSRACIHIYTCIHTCIHIHANTFTRIDTHTRTHAQDQGMGARSKIISNFC